MKNIKTILLVSFAVIFTSIIIAKAFTEPPNTVITQDVKVPINTGSSAQFKEGGLGINSGKAPNGLIIVNTNTPGSESLGIGLKNPSEKLQVEDGHIRINTGNIVTGGNGAGTTDNYLSATTTTTNAATMEWSNIAWLSIPRVDVVTDDGAGGLTCLKIWPECPAGWNPYSQEIFSDTCALYEGTYKYMATRTCYQNFNPN
ncbi:MAG: hypothetical protein EXS49_01885 [Candidatus Pacebacteria bacterium]|nr:hypothetical protein [Candidatus Paceibacterota bacterium]